MVPKIGAQYLVKKFADYVTAPPPEAPGAGQDERPPEQAARGEPAAPAMLDGEVITDEEGEAVGVARHVRDVALYIVGTSYGDRAEALRQAAGDPETRVLFHTVDGKLAGLIYVPNPENAPPPTAGMRADEI